MYAALFKRKDVLDALVSNGADLTAEDISGNNSQGLARGDIRPACLRSAES